MPDDKAPPPQQPQQPQPSAPKPLPQPFQTETVERGGGGRDGEKRG